MALRKYIGDSKNCGGGGDVYSLTPRDSFLMRTDRCEQPNGLMGKSQSCSRDSQDLQQ